MISGSRRKKITQTEIKEIRKQGQRVLIGGICIHIILGSFYSFAGFSIYIASYLKSNYPSINADLIALIFPFMNITMNACIPFGEKFVNKFGIRTALFYSFFFLSAFYLITSYTQSALMLAFMFGFMIGPIYGLLYMIPFFSTWKYFPLIPGRINTLLQAGFGFGACLFTYLAFILVNPDSEEAKRIEMEHGMRRVYYEECIGYQVPIMLRWFSKAIAVMGIIIVVLFWKPPNPNLDAYGDYERNQKERLQKNEKKEEDEQKRAQQQRMLPQSECISLMQGLKSRQFLLLLSMAIMSTFFGAFVISYYKTFGIVYFNYDSSLTTVGALSFVLFGGARGFWNKVLQKYGFKKVLFAILAAKALFIYLLLASVRINKPEDENNHYFGIYAISIACIIILQGGLYSWFSQFTPKIFGFKYASLIFGCILISFAVANLFVHLFVYSTLQDILPFKLNALFHLSFLMMCGVAVILHYYDENPKWI